jgi:hypothetical protein
MTNPTIGKSIPRSDLGVKDAAPRKHQFDDVRNDARVCSRCGMEWLQGSKPAGPCRTYIERQTASPPLPSSLRALARFSALPTTLEALETLACEVFTLGQQAQRFLDAPFMGHKMECDLSKRCECQMYETCAVCRRATLICSCGYIEAMK